MMSSPTVRQAEEASATRADPGSKLRILCYIPAYNAAATIPSVLDRIPEHMKDRIATYHAEHSWEVSRTNTFSRPATEEEKRERPPVVHPIVRTHPVTGRKLLYMGHHTSHIVELPYGEGRALLYQLLDFATQPHRVYTHRWRKGDLVMWDNRCLVHRGMRDFDMTKHRRLLHRTVLKGSVPY